MLDLFLTSCIQSFIADIDASLVVPGAWCLKMSYSSPSWLPPFEDPGTRLRFGPRQGYGPLAFFDKCIPPTSNSDTALHN